MPASVPLYTQHITEAAQLRSILSALKGLIDNPTFRSNLISLNAVEANISSLPFPQDLVGRTSALSLAIQNFDTTLAAIENGIRGVVLYPTQG